MSRQGDLLCFCITPSCSPSGCVWYIWYFTQAHFKPAPAPPRAGSQMSSDLLFRGVLIMLFCFVFVMPAIILQFRCRRALFGSSRRRATSRQADRRWGPMAPPCHQRLGQVTAAVREKDPLMTAYSCMIPALDRIQVFCVALQVLYHYPPGLVKADFEVQLGQQLRDWKSDRKTPKYLKYSPATTFYFLNGLSDLNVQILCQCNFNFLLYDGCFSIFDKFKFPSLWPSDY